MAKPINELTLAQLNYILDHIEVDPNTGCENWTGSLAGGYGVHAHMRVHRVTKFIQQGRLNPSLTIDHLCRNTRCVNPDHLEEVTVSENSRRMQEATRRDTCPRGHTLAGGNLIKALTVRGKHPGRACRACDTAARAARHRGLHGEERETFIQLNADGKYSLYMKEAA